MKLGNMLESVVAHLYTEATGKQGVEIGTTYHSDYSYMFANIDRLLPDNGILECKTASPFMMSEWGEEGTDNIPLGYLLQVAYYALILDAPYVDIAVLFGNSAFKRYTYRRNKKLEANIERIVKQFWEENVLKLIPPAPINQSDMVKLWKQSTETTFKQIDEMGEILYYDTLLLRKQYMDVEALYEKKKDELRMYLEANEVLYDRDHQPIVTNKWSNRTDFDEKKFKEENPELFAKYLRQKSIRRLHFLKGKESE